MKRFSPLRLTIKARPNMIEQINPFTFVHPSQLAITQEFTELIRSLFVPDKNRSYWQALCKVLIAKQTVLVQRELEFCF